MCDRLYKLQLRSLFNADWASAVMFLIALYRIKNRRSTVFSGTGFLYFIKQLLTIGELE
jgi:hypothetical protein